MIAASIVMAIALSDVIGWVAARTASPSERLAPAVPVALLAWAVVASALGLLCFGPVGLLIGAVALAWPPLTGRWPAAALGFLTLVAAAAVAGAWLPEPAFATARFAVGPLAVSGAKLTAVAAVAVFLGLSANLLCRGALTRARVREASALVAERGVPTAERVSVGEALRRRFAVPAPRPQELRGGRLIGPLERWLIVALALVGAQAIVGALMAAKGIVRFPEISKNSGEGSKAEEFLVGSLISWGLAGAGAALIALTP